MSNVLDETKHQKVIALGRLGWSLRRIEGATGVRREMVSGSLKAAGVAVRGRGGSPSQWSFTSPSAHRACRQKIGRLCREQMEPVAACEVSKAMPVGEPTRRRRH